MKATRESSTIEYAISILTDQDMDNLLKQADEEAQEVLASDGGSQQFEVKSFEVLDVSKNNDQYTVTYENTKPISIKGTSTFDLAPIVQKGYEPTNVSEKGKEFTVTFDKTDWNLNN